MQVVPLTQGKHAIVDDEDFDRVSPYNWYFRKPRRTCGYAATNFRLPAGKVTIRMHHIIMGQPLLGLQVDHINGKGTDNRKTNIRLATNRLNAANRFKRSRTTSKYKGVYWHKKEKRWQAQIKDSGVRIYLGRFNDEVEAARAYDKAAIVRFGEFARLNLRQAETKEQSRTG